MFLCESMDLAGPKRPCLHRAIYNCQLATLDLIFDHSWELCRSMVGPQRGADWNANSYDILHLWHGLDKTFVATTHTLVLHHLQESLELCRHFMPLCLHGLDMWAGSDTWEWKLQPFCRYVHELPMMEGSCYVWCGVELTFGFVLNPKPFWLKHRLSYRASVPFRVPELWCCFPMSNNKLWRIHSQGEVRARQSEDSCKQSTSTVWWIQRQQHYHYQRSYTGRSQ